jgi:hypothetical protein
VLSDNYRYYPINALNKIKMEKKLLSMSDAAKLCPYAQDYLSLLARRGELKAEKIGNKWYTRIEWLNDYLEEKKPNEVIKNNNNEVNRNKVKRNKSMVKSWGLAIVGLFLVALFIYQFIVKRVNELESDNQSKVFIPEEITKIPNESGGYDVYGEGKVKMGEETP